MSSSNNVFNMDQLDPAIRGVLSSILTKYDGGPKTGIFTDGSCQINPGKGGWGVVQVSQDEIICEKAGFAEQTTNNRMELVAMIEGLRLLDPKVEYEIFSDSQLVVNTLNKWAQNWAKLGWKRKTGKIANIELVQEAYALFLDRPLAKVRWIKAHNGEKWNEYADTLASLYLR